MAHDNVYQQSKAELEEHLHDTIEAIGLSARAFDLGSEGEAKRLAAAIRVLVHDTIQSHSLLGQLGKKNVAFHSTAAPKNPKNLLTYSGIVAQTITPTGGRYIAPLDFLPDDMPIQELPFDEWWNEVIFMDKDKEETTRKDLILAVANKDGGAHVDPNLDEKYANLSRKNSLAWQHTGPMGTKPMPGPQLAAVRQIAHELLRTFNPTMPLQKPNADNIFMGMEATVSDTPQVSSQPQAFKRVGRNEPCPCGSGKKYKRCHGRG